MAVGQFFDLACTSFQSIPESFQSGLKGFGDNASSCVKKTLSDVQELCFDDVKLLQDRASFCAKKALTAIQEVFADATKVTNSTDPFRNTVRIFESTLDIVNSLVSKPIYPLAHSAFRATGNMLLATCIFGSANYFLRGRFIDDFMNSQYWKVTYETCFAVARIGLTATWLDSQKLVNLGHLTTLVGNCPYIGFAAKLSTFPLIDYAFLVGSTTIAAERLRQVYTGEITTSGMFDLANAVSECALTAFILVGVSSPVVIGGLGVVAASSSVMAFLTS